MTYGLKAGIKKAIVKLNMFGMPMSDKELSGIVKTDWHSG